MADPVAEASQVVAPLLSAGADGVAAAALRQAREGGNAAARRVLDAARKALGGKNADESSVAAALRAGLDEGAITESDLRQAAKVLRANRDNYEVRGNVYTHTSIIVNNGDFKG